MLPKLDRGGVVVGNPKRDGAGRRSVCQEIVLTAETSAQIGQRLKDLWRAASAAQRWWCQLTGAGPHTHPRSHHGVPIPRPDKGANR